MHRNNVSTILLVMKAWRTFYQRPWVQKLPKKPRVRLWAARRAPVSGIVRVKEGRQLLGSLCFYGKVGKAQSGRSPWQVLRSAQPHPQPCLLVSDFPLSQYESVFSRRCLVFKEMSSLAVSLAFLQWLLKQLCF